jgi:hypothetical protein
LAVELPMISAMSYGRSNASPRTNTARSGARAAPSGAASRTRGCPEARWSPADRGHRRKPAPAARGWYASRVSRVDRSWSSASRDTIVIRNGCGCLTSERSPASSAGTPPAPRPRRLTPDQQPVP